MRREEEWDMDWETPSLPQDQLAVEDKNVRVSFVTIETQFQK